MYRKLKFFKMFLGTILMTLTLISVLKSCSYAYTLDEFLDFTQQVHDMNINQYFNYVTNRILTYKDELKSMNDINNYSNYICTFNNDTTPSNIINIYASNTGIDIYRQNSTQIQLPSNKSFKSTSIKYAGGWQPTSNKSVNYFQRMNSFGLTSYTGSADFTGYYWQNTYIPPPTGPVFTPVDNGMINVTNSLGTTIQMNRLPFSRSLTSWKVGKITDIDDSILTIKGHFGPLVSSDNDGDITNTKYQFIWRKGDNVSSNGFTIASDGNVYINTQYLIPNQSYNAWFWYSTDNVNTTDFGDTWFYAYYNTSNPASGDSISSSLNDDTDIGFINAFGDIVSPQPEDIESTANSIFQNPYGSGEFFGITYDDDFDDWGFGTFIYNLIQGIITTFTSFNNVSMDFGVLGVINSSTFSIGNSYVGAFLSFFCNAILVITLIFWYYRLVKSFATLDLTTISKYDFDKMFNIF